MGWDGVMGQRQDDLNACTLYEYLSRGDSSKMEGDVKATDMDVYHRLLCSIGGGVQKWPEAHARYCRSWVSCTPAS
jgi:hypothetical protein